MGQLNKTITKKLKCTAAHFLFCVPICGQSSSTLGIGVVNQNQSRLQALGESGILGRIPRYSAV